MTKVARAVAYYGKEMCLLPATSNNYDNRSLGLALLSYGVYVDDINRIDPDILKELLSIVGDREWKNTLFYIEEVEQMDESEIFLHVILHYLTTYGKKILEKILSVPVETYFPHERTLEKPSTSLPFSLSEIKYHIHVIPEEQFKNRLIHHIESKTALSNVDREFLPIIIQHYDLYSSLNPRSKEIESFLVKYAIETGQSTISPDSFFRYVMYTIDGISIVHKIRPKRRPLYYDEFMSTVKWIKRYCHPTEEWKIYLSRKLRLIGKLLNYMKSYDDDIVNTPLWKLYRKLRRNNAKLARKIIKENHVFENPSDTQKIVYWSYLKQKINLKNVPTKFIARFVEYLRYRLREQSKEIRVDKKIVYMPWVSVIVDRIHRYALDPEEVNYLLNECMSELKRRFENVKINCQEAEFIRSKRLDPGLPTSSSVGLPTGTRFYLNQEPLYIGIHWYNSEHHQIDLDLAAALITERNIRTISWDTSYKNDLFVFSGDITDAPREKGGGAEYIYWNGQIPSDKLDILFDIRDYTGYGCEDVQLIICKKMENNLPVPNSIVFSVPLRIISYTGISLGVLCLNQEHPYFIWVGKNDTRNRTLTSQLEIVRYIIERTYCKVRLSEVYPLEKVEHGNEPITNVLNQIM